MNPAASPIRIPPPLLPGDRVVLFAPASHQGREPTERLQQALKILKSWGLRAELPLESTRHLYLAGPDQARAQAFQRLYLQPDIKALFATRGGWGSARILPHLDKQALNNTPPKHVIGMSDITSLLCWLRRHTNLATLHAPCLATSQLMNSPVRNENLTILHHMLFNPQRTYFLNCQIIHWPQDTPNHLEGELIGGCLSVLASGMGTPWQPHTEQAFLFLEDTDEPPYRLDRLLTQLQQAGALQHIRALLLGNFQRCDQPPGLLGQLWEDLFQHAPFPVVHQIPAGHGDVNHSLPLGRTATLHAPDPHSEKNCSLLF